MTLTDVNARMFHAFIRHELIYGSNQRDAEFLITVTLRIDDREKIQLKMNPEECYEFMAAMKLHCILCANEQSVMPS